MRKKQMLCGWCQSGVAHRDAGPGCPRVMRIARITDKGTEHREIVCACKLCVDDA